MLSKYGILVLLLSTLSLGYAQENDKALKLIERIGVVDSKKADSLLVLLDTAGMSDDHKAKYIWLKLSYSEESKLDPYAKVNLNPSHRVLAMMLSAQGIYFVNKYWDPVRAKDKVEKAYELLNNNPSTFDDFETAYIGLNYAVLQVAQYHTAKASRIANEYATIVERLPCNKWSLQFLNALVLCNVESNRPDIGKLCGQKAMDCLLIVDSNHVNRRSNAALFNNLGQLNIVNGNYYDALKCQLKAKEILDTPPKESYFYEWYWHMGWLQTELGNYELADSYIESARDKIERSLGRNSHDYFLINLVKLTNLVEKGDTAQSRTLINELLTLSDDLKLEWGYKKELLKLEAKYYEITGDIVRSQKLRQTILNHLKKSEEKDILLLPMYKYLIQGHDMLEQNEEARSLIKEVNVLIHDHFELSGHSDILEIMMVDAKFLTTHIEKEEKYLDVLQRADGRSRWLKRGYYGLSRLYYGAFVKTGKFDWLLKSVNAIDSASHYAQKGQHYSTDFKDKLVSNKENADIEKLGAQISFSAYELDKSPNNADRLFRYLDYSKYDLIKERMAIDKYHNIAGVDEEVLERERELRSAIAAHKKAISNLDSTERAVIKKELSDLIGQHTVLLEEISVVSKSYYDYFIGESPVDIKEFQSYLSPQTTFLSYSLVDDSLFIMLIGDQGVSFYVSEASELKENIATLKIAADKNQFKKYRSAAYSLYKVLLLPYMDALKDKKVYVSFDPSMYSFNLETLITDPGGGSFADLSFVLHQMEISYVLSASTFVLSHRHAGKKDIDKNLALFVPHISEDKRMLRQPFFRAAAKKISVKNQGDLFIDNEATKDNFKAGLEEYKTVVVGSHTVLSFDAPLKTKLYFTEDSTDRDILYLSEVFEIKTLSDLVVLASCSGSAGSLAQGIGLMSLANGFAYSGCRSIICSLWDIDERSTSKIVDYMFTGSNKRNSINERLRQAKLTYLDANKKQPKLANPIYWGGLILIGQDNVVSFHTPGGRAYGKFAFIGLLIVLAYFFFRRK